ncbi:hypothetical protein PssvBMR1_gp02 [Pseudomonas phage MR1]|uniref:Uncharacterized protein n=1 Tax=Pseudomonas phage MR1 TaxID=2711169 RepID=A0A6M3TCJ7_9CAUD|nr:hypothetical protein PssvBMR1_gp02 [Pseudomonas phage MR1]
MNTEGVDKQHKRCKIRNTNTDNWSPTTDQASPLRRSSGLSAGKLHPLFNNLTLQCSE